jgi:hypothetical protein
MSSSEEEDTKTVKVLKVGGLNYLDWSENLADTLALKGLSAYTVMGPNGTMRKERPGDHLPEKQEKYDIALGKTMAIIRRSLGDNRSTIRGYTDPAKALQAIKLYFSQSSQYDAALLQQKWTTLTPVGDDVPGYMAEMNRLKSDLAEVGRVFDDAQLIAQMMLQLKKYPLGHPYRKAHDQIDYKLTDSGEVDIPYFTRFISKAAHELAETERDLMDEDKAFLAKAKMLGYKKFPGTTSNSMDKRVPGTITRSSPDLACRFCRSPNHQIANCDNPNFDPKIWKAHKERVKEKDLKGGGQKGDDPGKNSANVASSNACEIMESSIDIYERVPSPKDPILPYIDERLYLATNKGAGTIMDSGCSRCMFHESGMFAMSPNMREHRSEIKIGNGSSIWSTHVGDLYLSSNVQGDKKQVHLSNCLLVPELNINLISIAQLDATGHSVVFKEGVALVKQGKDIVMCGDKRENLYYIEVKPEECQNAFTAISADLWHKRLGHFNTRKLPKLAEAVKGLEKLNGKEHNCELCVLGKMTRASFPSSSTKRKRPLELLHMDLAGPSAEASIDGGRYMLVIVDDYSRYYHIDILKSKDEAFTKIKEFVLRWEKQLDLPVKTIRSDNGGEFVNHRVRDFLKEKGIVQELTTPYTPEQNGVAERSFRTIKEGTRTLLLQANLKPKYWASAAKTFVYTRNKTLSTSLKDGTPEERFTGDVPDVSDLRVYGCVAYAHTPKSQRDTWSPTAKRCVFVGYGQEQGVKGWILYDPYTRKKIVTRHATFREDVVWNKEPQFHSRFDLIDKVADISACRDGLREDGADVENFAPEDDEDGPNNPDDRPNDPDDEGERGNQHEPPNEPDPPRGNAIEPVQRPQAEPAPAARRILPQRNRRPPEPYWLNANCAIHLPLESMLEQAYSAELNPQDPRFHEAKLEELESMRKHEVWDLVTLPPGRKAISARWVCTLKEKPDGTTREKARLVVRGFTQVEGVDYTEIFAPVVKMESLRLVLSLATLYDLELAQADVKTAFLYGKLDEEVYMKQPPGYEHEDRSLVCKLKKSLYGLHQSPRNFYRHIRGLLANIGLHALKTDESIFVSKEESGMTILALYVDDALLAASSKGRIQQVKRFLFDNFEMTWTDNPSMLLGIEIIRERALGKLSINQNRFVKSILEDFDMIDSTPTRLPMVELLPSTRGEKPAPDKLYPYLQLIGKLNYLARGTRPDLSFAVSHLASFCSEYQKEHWDAALRVLRYLVNGNASITYDRSQGSTIVGYSDADYGSDPGNRRSVGAYVFLFVGGAITWQSKKQATVSWSSTESEYIALGSAAREAMWLNHMCDEIDLDIPKTITIFEDNQAAIALSRNPVQHSRTKHIDICHHGLRDFIDSGRLAIQYINTSEMLADALTKPLNGRKLRDLSVSMGLAYTDKTEDVDNDDSS